MSNNIKHNFKDNNDIVNNLNNKLANLSNSNNTFVNLSHLLLKKIVGYLDDMFQQMLFTMVCKKWYEERYKYLVLKVGLSNERDDLVHLKSFSTCVTTESHRFQLVVISEDDFGYYHDEYHLYYKTATDPSTILKPNTYSLMLNRYVDIDISLFKDVLENCANCRSISLAKYQKPLNSNSFPKNLEKLELIGYLLPLENGSLPNGLKILKFKYSYYLPMSASVFPTTLTELIFADGYQFELAVGGGDSKVLPQSLTKIKHCPVSWIKYLKYLPNLRYLSFDGYCRDGVLEPGSLPSTLTTLDFGESIFRLSGASIIPSSVRHLNLGGCIIDLALNVLPFDAHYDYLCALEFHAPILPNQLPPNIKELQLTRYNKPLVPGSLPVGIEVLKLPYIDSEKLLVGTIPNTVKKLSLFLYEQEQRFPIECIPNSIETLDLGKYNLDFDFKMIIDINNNDDHVDVISNSNNSFVNLSHLLLEKIVGNLDDMLDQSEN
ncbi:hypothetical protein PPL_00724 [Heterostelium album PN500]|uniref:FNIP repeat-containing protein n=1 Tax=Heterostelium pallidum (strain ATCC 26659 / Pp 5 / PN500) TaxID=670386 RepID=D3AX93_HETP5|nr:hypothetical protein PPL_00724 [Heterostelium album PN500]EFA86162.1 hypothetical protein PPL_00724 [Heterostelium album PN500]|eukprot:XP_020438267.1 hypothetical protein PPL_00724 [Heterostelium album PN500]